MSIEISADLSGRTALVTGGISGIGLCTVRRFCSLGAKVAVNHLPDDPRVESTIAELKSEGFDIISAPGNIGSDVDNVQGFIDEATDTLGKLDYLINNAGISLTDTPIPAADMHKLDDAFWMQIINVNLLGAFRCTRAAKAALAQSNGAIVNIASVAGINRPGSSIAYGASKAGLIKMTRDLGKALGRSGIRVNAVAPGFVRTEWTSTWDKDYRDRLIAETPLGDMTEPDDIAECVLFLCCSRFVTGQTVVVDGGMTL